MKRIFKYKFKILFLILCSSSISLILLLDSKIPEINAGNQLNINDYDYEGIDPEQIQFFSIYNNAEDTTMIINLTALMFEGSINDYPNIKLDVFKWESYTPGKTSTLVSNTSSLYYGKVEFQCEDKTRYLIRIKNTYTASTESSVYNISFIAENGVDIPVSGYTNYEQFVIEEKITVSYYHTTDPWLYDSYNTEDRLVLMMGQGPLYTAFVGVQSGGERYFWIKNYLSEDITLFFGVNVYTGASCMEYPFVTLAVYDWEDLDAGVQNENNYSDLALETEFTIGGNHSCGFNFICEAGHTYQVYFSNDDTSSGCNIFLNATIYSWEQAKVDFDSDLEDDPGSEILVRLFLSDPWLEYRNEMRNIYWMLIFGGVGGVGLAFTIFWVKVRYL